MAKIVLVSIALLAWSASAGYHPDRVHHVDSVSGASLFRGAAPVANNTFVIDALLHNPLCEGEPTSHPPLQQTVVAIVVHTFGDRARGPSPMTIWASTMSVQFAYKFRTTFH